ncbi:MAG: protein phosphatase 2C domain-containing protein [Deltaproteobacteria bacterium]|nr:protein phosphatase 2C domain-containing protein [Deltaproteobacteria bacterium]
MSEEPGSPPAGDGPVIDQDGQLDAESLGVVSWITDVGHARKRNEDRLLVKRAFDGRFLLLVVADGAGGHNRGDLAATTVVETLNEVFATEGSAPEGPPADWLNRVILDIHQQVRDLAEGENRPPAATLVGLLVEEETLCGWRFHVGDSRLYGRRPDQPMMTWTRDHNITNGLIDRGLPAAQALKIAEGGKLTQVMGGGAVPEPDIRGPFQLAGGDSFLICSDGVFGYNGNTDPLSPAIDPSSGDIVERAAALKAAVLAGDAMDNLTAVLWDVPPGDGPKRQRLGLVEPYDTQDVSTMVNLTAHRPGRASIGPSGPPPPQSMPTTKAVSDADIANNSPTDEDLARANARLSSNRGANAGLKLGGLLVAALLILAAFGYARRDTTGGANMTEAEMERQRAEARALAGLPPEGASTAAAEPPADDTPPPSPVEAATPMDPALAQLMAGFEPGWWQGLTEVQRDERAAVLKELLGTKAGTPMALSWEVGEPPMVRETSRTDWLAPGGANGELAAAAWSARGRILGLHGDLAGQPGVPEAMRVAACDQVKLRWPRGLDASPGDAVQLPSWLGACLPAEVDGAEVTVRLGSYPDAGWTDEDWNELATLAGSPGGAASITKFDFATWNPRLVELGQLTAALAQPKLQDIEIEVRVALAASDSLPLAEQRAEQIADLFRDGSAGVLQVQSMGVNDDPLVDPDDNLLPGQASKVAGLNRRVEITLFRSSAIELDEDEAVSPEPK